MKNVLPQLIYLALTLFGLGAAMALHGRSKEGNISFATNLIGSLIALSLLYWGGFFTPLGF